MNRNDQELKSSPKLLVIVRNVINTSPIIGPMYELNLIMHIKMQLQQHLPLWKLKVVLCKKQKV